MPPADNVPEELREPFYTDQYEQEHIKPPVVRLLLSAELYCRAGSLILKSDAAKPLLGHDAVIQALAQKGLYVTDQERLVTERDLHKKPIQMVSPRGHPRTRGRGRCGGRGGGRGLAGQRHRCLELRTPLLPKTQGFEHSRVVTRVPSVEMEGGRGPLPRGRGGGGMSGGAAGGGTGRTQSGPGVARGGSGHRAEPAEGHLGGSGGRGVEGPDGHGVGLSR